MLCTYLTQEHLKACGRAHTLSDTYSAIETLKSSGVGSWSLDLISGLPRLTPAEWQHSLNEAVAAGPDHVSVYDLQVGGSSCKPQAPCPQPHPPTHPGNESWPASVQDRPAGRQIRCCLASCHKAAAWCPQ
jgi:hypothetical protein